MTNPLAKNTIKTYGFSLFMFILFMVHQFVEPFYKHKLIDSYLDDICFLPVAYGFVKLLIQQSIDHSFKLSISHAITGLVVSILATEILFPALSNKHTADFYDGIAYMIGSILFMLFGNKQFNNNVG
ncbi:MAG: hypothetical protein JXQ87_01655 [Bacteroidia bacterium]